MASSEPGPELDRRVAEAMGVPPGQMRERMGSPVIAYYYPTYSTDPARIAEMVEWLKGARVASLEIATHIDAGWRWAAGYDDMLGCVHGDSIEHALALLVVAVGASDGE